MRTPRQLYTQEEMKQLENTAQQGLENLAAAGIYLPYSLCLELAEFAVIERQVQALMARFEAVRVTT